MVEEEIEFGDSDLLKSQKGYTLCDGCDVELTASDDIFESNCNIHLLCSDCYNLWMDGFEKLNFVITQDRRKHIQHILCPICDDVISDHGKLNLNKISLQIDTITNNRHPNEYSTNYTSNESEVSNKSLILKRVELSSSAQQTDDTSHSNFEIISCTDLLNPT